MHVWKPKEIERVESRVQKWKRLLRSGSWAVLQLYRLSIMCKRSGFPNLSAFLGFGHCSWLKGSKLHNRPGCLLANLRTWSPFAISFFCWGITEEAMCPVAQLFKGKRVLVLWGWNSGLDLGFLWTGVLDLQEVHTKNFDSQLLLILPKAGYGQNGKPCPGRRAQSKFPPLWSWWHGEKL